MEYDEMIARMRPAEAEAPETSALMGGVRRAVRHRRQRNALLAGAATAVLAVAPLATQAALPSTGDAPMLAEQVSLQQPPAADNLPAPWAGYLHSTRNQQICNRV